MPKTATGKVQRRLVAKAMIEKEESAPPAEIGKEDVEKTASSDSSTLGDKKSQKGFSILLFFSGCLGRLHRRK